MLNASDPIGSVGPILIVPLFWYLAHLLGELFSFVRKLEDQMKEIGVSLIGSLVELMSAPGMLKKDITDVDGNQAG